MVNIPKSFRRVLITGGSGFIGSTLVRKLIVDTNVTVFNLDKLGYASSKNLFEGDFDTSRYVMLEVDLCDSVATKKAINTSDPDIVFHLAAESHVDRSIFDPEVFVQSNIVGTFNLLQALLSHWKNLDESRKKLFRMLHVSTDEVFGSISNNELFTELSPYNPRNPYSATKAASDHLVRTWRNTYGLPTLITNSGNNYGPRQFSEKLIPTIILNALSCNPIPIYGDGRNIRDWIYVDDHIDALIKVMVKGKKGETYCIGSGVQKTNLEIVHIVCELLDIYIPSNSPHIRFLELIEDRKGHDKKYAINSSKINKELNWHPRFDIKQGISSTIEWYLQKREVNI